jgi:hypothetical protein
VKSVEDLDFSQEIESEDDSSYFAEEGSIQLFDFYVATEDVEDFATALDELCTEYATDEDYYFDYEETEEDGTTYAEMSNFDITLEDAEGFLEALDALCDEWAEDEDYDYSVEGVDGSAEDSEDDEAADENDDEASEEDILTLTDFYIYTENSEQVVDKIDKLCAKHSQESEHYEYDWQEEEDEDGTYVSFTRFEIIPDDEDAFLAALEALCEKLAEDGGYDWE